VEHLAHEFDISYGGLTVEEETHLPDVANEEEEDMRRALLQMRQRQFPASPSVGIRQHSAPAPSPSLRAIPLSAPEAGGVAAAGMQLLFKGYVSD
jgi:hypothetical protein